MNKALIGYLSGFQEKKKRDGPALEKYFLMKCLLKHQF
jgi:hypothetical protein